MERVRLIIWDLDETFWHGTLTEGGIRIRPDLCRLVIDLAQRGIMSSICSKNDLEPVKKILVEHGVWDYFIFPSIDWQPKGPRIAAMIEQVQLRPPTVMFIDDNPLNLQEVLHFVPEIQVRSHEFIPEIADSPLFVGKDDRGLKRLTQYKLLEKRKADESQAGGNVSEFLRSSNIRVELEWNIEQHIDRVVELINRTNQLNFTKKRLSEDPEEARQQALGMFRRYNTQAALVRVVDRYGDHGFSGFYAYNSDAKRIEHFCFSCRILGMGVEHWLYDRLGRPTIFVKGEVLSDLKAERPAVDWINQSGNALEEETARLDLNVHRMIVHGGCDLAAVGHYFTLHNIDILSELNLMRKGMSLRTDHTVFLDRANSRLSAPELLAAKALCYDEIDFASDLFCGDLTGHAVLLSFATDGHHALYRHRQTGLTVPCVTGLGPVYADATAHTVEELPEADRAGIRGQVLTTLKSEFDYIGLIQEQDFKKGVRKVFQATGSAYVFVIRPRDYHINASNGSRLYAKNFVDLNSWTADVAADFPNVELIDIADYAQDETEMENILHYDRKVYFRLYKYILSRLTKERVSGSERVVEEMSA